MKKILILITVIVLTIVGFSVLRKSSEKYIKDKQKEEFIQNATAYLEQKYNIKITDCAKYYPSDIGYHDAMLDGGYFTYSAEGGIFIDSSGSEIRCTNRNGNLTDDYEEEKLYKNFYGYVSEKLGVDVKYIRFDNCGQEVVYNNYTDHYVNKNIYLFLERSTVRYAAMDPEVFFNDLLGYFDEGDMNIYALENENTNREQLLQNTENFKNGTDLDAVYISVYPQNTDLRRKDDNSQSDILYNGINSNYLYEYDYYVICNGTGTRMATKEEIFK